MQDKPAEWYDALDTLVQNGMFRNREHDGKPISGSDADFLYDDEEYEHYAKLIGCVAK